MAAGGALALCGATYAVNGAAAAVSHKKLTPLQQGLAFYKGKTLTYIAPTAAGSAYDVESRAFAYEMGQYLGATINVENISTGGSIPGQDALAASPANGLTIGFFNTASDFYDIVSNIPGVNFNIKNVAFLGGLPNTVSTLATQTNSPYTSFKVLVQTATAAKPAKVLITSGAAATEVFLLMKEFGIPAQYISGYANSSALAVGYQRGDGQLIGTGVAAILADIQSGQTRVLALETATVKPPTTLGDYAQLKSVPTVPELLKQFPPKTAAERQAIRYAVAVNAVPSFVLGAPSATPKDDVLALDAATKYAARTVYVETRVNAVGNTTGFTDATKDKVAYENALGLANEIKAFLGN